MFWDDLAGSTIGGRYRLGELIGHTSRSAVYRVSQGNLKLAMLDELPVATPSFEHNHILQLFDTGVCEVGRSHLRYFVTESADASLTTTIAARAMSPEETREMLGPILEAMAYLHDRGLAHGRICPGNILRTSEGFKLSGDSVRPEGAVYSAAKDMRALGLTIIEALTRVRQPSLIASLPQPFQDIVEGALEMDPVRQLTAQAAANWLSRPAVLAAPPVERPARLAGQICVYATAALLLMVGSVFVGGHRPRPASPPSVHPAPPPVTVSQTTEPPVGGDGHMVVVGSFSRHENALHQAELIAHKWPQFRPKVSPPSPAGYYLVILASDLSVERAQSLRQQAVELGLPPDTYVKKFPPR